MHWIKGRPGWCFYASTGGVTPKSSPAAPLRSYNCSGWIHYHYHDNNNNNNNKNKNKNKNNNNNKQKQTKTNKNKQKQTKTNKNNNNKLALFLKKTGSNSNLLHSVLVISQIVPDTSISPASACAEAQNAKNSGGELWEKHPQWPLLPLYNLWVS